MAERDTRNADDLPPQRLGICPQCQGQYWGDGQYPCFACARQTAQEGERNG